MANAKNLFTLWNIVIQKTSLSLVNPIAFRCYLWGKTMGRFVGKSLHNTTFCVWAWGLLPVYSASIKTQDAVLVLVNNKARGTETMTHSQDFQDRFLRLPEVMRLTGLSRSVIYAWAKKGRFPKQTALGGKTSIWRLSEVNTWMDSAVGKDQAGQQDAA